MPYRQSAATREEVKVKLDLDEDEIKEAIFAFVKRNNMLPDHIE